ncbi:MAG: pyroglutamyl-peptidase I [Caldisericaceae bacterium]
MNLFLTGFEPFGGEKVNPSYEILRNIKDDFGGVRIVKFEVPTAYYVSIAEATAKVRELSPFAVLSIGQAGGRSSISLERIAINVSDTTTPDNLGQCPFNEPIDPSGKEAYFATIPLYAILNKLKENGIPASISNSAGTFVCNHLMYGILNYIHKYNLNTKAGFMHVPYLESQVVNKPNTPSMALETMVKAVETAIEVILDDSD